MMNWQPLCNGLWQQPGCSLNVDDLIALTMETGKHGVDVMALLDEANTSTYGNPEVTRSILVYDNLAF